MSFEREKIRWSTESTCKLIELYKKAPILWNPEHKEFKNRHKKADALTKIAITLGNASANEVSRKIKNINTQYMRERRNFKKLKHLGKYYQSKWFGYTLLSFLHVKCRFRKNMEDDSSEDIQESAVSAEYNEEPDIEFIKDEVSVKDTKIMPFDNIESDICTNYLNEHSQFNESSEIMQTDTISNQIQQNASTRIGENSSEELCSLTNPIQKKHLDDFDVFGDLVARKLRRLSTRYARCTTQNLIHNLLYEAEIGKFDEPNENSKANAQ